MACEGKSNVQTKCQGLGEAVWPGEVQVHTPISVAGTSRSYLIIMYAHGSSRMHLYLFILYFGAMHNYCCCLIFITISGEDFNLTAKESSEFSTGNFFWGGEGEGDFWGFLARFWRPNQLSGQILWKSEGLSENLEKFGEIGDLCLDKSVQLLDRPPSG